VVVARDFIFHSARATAPARQRTTRRLVTYGEDTRTWANRLRTTVMARWRAVLSASSARARPIAVTPGSTSAGDPSGQQVNPLFASIARTRRQRNGTLLANVRQSVTHGLHRGAGPGKSRALLRVSQVPSSLAGTNHTRSSSSRAATRKVSLLLDESNPHERSEIGEAEVAVTVDVSSAGGSERHQVLNPLLSTELAPGDDVEAIADEGDEGGGLGSEHRFLS
jgi:hypothetical protein